TLNGLRALVRFHQPEPRPFSPEQTHTREPGDGGLVQHPEGGIYLMAVAAVGDGRVLVLEQSIDQILALSGDTLGSVIARSVLLIITLMLVLLGYASWLSWRITRLQRAVDASVDSDGRILASIPHSRAPDELGELNRQFGRMVARLQGYTDYLEGFSRRLSHELKTPVAVIRSSLDNLEHATTDEERAGYRERARSATDRLSRILQGMSEAARLEQSFDHAELETFDLAQVAAEATAAYQSLDPHHRIVWQGPAQGCPLRGSPELMVQLLDKLVDNARDFTPTGGRILITLDRSGAELRLGVFNEGSALPETLAGQIFDPFVSVRDGSGEGHLGQGLLIVRLIAGHHGGQVSACNHEHEGVGGVRFEVRLPAAPDRPGSP
ncbi:MAG: ATP-binding protein, partial [Marinobacter sp.]